MSGLTARGGGNSKARKRTRRRGRKRCIVALFSSAGRRVELLRCFRESAAEENLQATILAADMNPAMSSACWDADEAFQVPRCTDYNYVSALLEICRRKGVDLLVPTIDTELDVLARAQARFRNIGTRVAISKHGTVIIARHKLATIRFLSSCGIPTPKTAMLDDLLADSAGWCWPLILKPLDGSSSIGVHVVADRAAAAIVEVNRETYVAQEFRRGKEYTVNCFFDVRGRLRCAIPHQRVETRAGEVSKGVTERVPVLMEIARLLGRGLKGRAFGALCFQAVVASDGTAYVFEINGRFGGGYPVAHRAGARFATWLLQEVAGVECTANENWEEGLCMLRYDAAVFVRPNRVVET